MLKHRVPPSEVNVEAFAALMRAIDSYLLSNGWELIEGPIHKWKVPKQFGIFAGDIAFQAHALDMQYRYDSEELRSG